jgi:pSer/pThr/pTyr-binding forkhead associated (FHA) protein
VQFRSQYKLNTEGHYQMAVKPYIMDLGSTNGTLLNNQKLDSSRYYELLSKDVIKFGLSDREYVMFKVP